MQFISAHNGKLQTRSSLEALAGTSESRSFVTGLDALDALAPKQSFARGAVHELLFQPNDGEPKFVATLIAQHGSASSPLPPLSSGEGWGEGASLVGGRLLTPALSQREREKSLPTIWSDPHGELYPPALAALGFDLRQLYLLRPKSPVDESWAITECLRCRGVGAVIATLPRITRIEARRFQLAAERGGGVGIFLRPIGRGDSIYAAATRWLVTPHPGERTIQRWTIQLLHGHGGRIGQSVILEWSREPNRENNPVRALEKLPSRSTAEATTPQRRIA